MQQGCIYKAYDVNPASKRPHLLCNKAASIRLTMLVWPRNRPHLLCNKAASIRLTMLVWSRRGSIYKAYDANPASKRPHLSNPMCSVSGTWGIKIQDKKSASKMPHIRLYDMSLHGKVCLSAAVLYPIHCWAMVYPLLCDGISAVVRHLRSRY